MNHAKTLAWLWQPSVVVSAANDAVSQPAIHLARLATLITQLTNC